jgi:DNA primase
MKQTDRVRVEHKKEALGIPIVEYLESRGYKLEPRGDRYVCLSPLNNESEPSFYIYPENKFYDFSSGSGGDIINLVRMLENLSFIDAIRHILVFKKEHDIESKDFTRDSENREKFYGKFNVKDYVTSSKDAIEKIDAYAISRCFNRASYVPARYVLPFQWTGIDGEEHVNYITKSGVGFPISDFFGKIVGLKIRDIDPGQGEPKFILRGAPGFYVLDNMYDIKKDSTLYIVESETSAASFYSYILRKKINAVIISFGGVSNVPSSLPFKYEWMGKRKLIIDFDGDKNKYDERVENFRHLNAEAIEIPTDKGLDLSVLSVKGGIEAYVKE